MTQSTKHQKKSSLERASPRPMPRIFIPISLKVQPPQLNLNLNLPTSTTAPTMPTSKLLIAPLLLILHLASSALSGPPTAYELLEQHNLPRGLLPYGVESFLLQKDGSFDVYFDGECEFKIQDKYVLRYKRRISGKLEDGAIKDLHGVSVKILFLWLGIGEVDRVGDELSFYVGFISASFPIASFEKSPTCRGFDYRASNLGAADADH